MVLAVDQPHPEVDHRVAGEVAARGAPPEMPFSTAGRKLCGMAPPKISSSNSKSSPRGSGSMMILQSANWPRPPVCFLCRPWPSAVPLDGLAVGHLRRVEDDLDLVALLQLGHRDLDVQLAGAREQELAGLRVAAGAQAGSSSSRRWRASPIFSSSPFDLGSRAKEIAGGGIWIQASATGRSLAVSVSPVCVSLELGHARRCRRRPAARHRGALLALAAPSACRALSVSSRAGVPHRACRSAACR